MPDHVVQSILIVIPAFGSKVDQGQHFMIGVVATISCVCPVHERYLHQAAYGSQHTHLDGKGCWRVIVFFERRWRSIKYAKVECTPTKA